MMNSELRDKLRLSASCDEKELREACNRYYMIYSGIKETASDPYVKKIAEAKLSDLVTSAAKEGITVDGAADFELSAEEAVPFCDVEKQLNDAATDENGLLLPSQHSKLDRLISPMPESAKKNYLRFMLVRNYEGLNEESAKKMKAFLENAKAEDSENIVYSELYRLIDDALEKYKTDKQAYKREIECRRRREMVKNFFRWIGGGILKLAGWYFSILAGMFAVFISCICDDC